MANSNNEDLADALSRLAGGDVAPSEHEPAAPPKPPAAPGNSSGNAPANARAVRPASTRPAAPRQAAPAPVVPPAAPQFAPPIAAPRPVRPASPSLGSTPPVPPPKVSNSPPPVIRAVAPVSRKVRPAAPTIGAPAPTEPSKDAEVDGGQSTGLTQQAESTEIIDDDDMMNIPAAEASVFQTKPRANLDARAKSAARKNLELRRTFIPILLTCGVMMMIFASLKFVSGADSMLSAAVPMWVPPVLGFVAIILLALAVMNMLSVKHQLDASTKK